MVDAAHRQFYSLPTQSELRSEEDEDKKTLCDNDNHNASETVQTAVANNDYESRQQGLLSYIASNIIGADKTFTGPYGLRKAVYLDFVASGRSLRFIEDYIQDEVLPEYGNTHTTTNITSLQTTLYRHEARDIIRNACNASEHDSVIFAGSGTTGAVHKLIHNMDLKRRRTVVFVGPYEHHSNILPWEAAGAKIVRIDETDSGHLDVHDLEEKLKAYKSLNCQMIGAFSAASNITGLLTDTDSVTVCLHRNGALAFWDYATAAPYVKVDMNPYVGGANQDLVYKDAIYFSVHKFVGGVSTPGVLIAKKALFQHPVPHACGGGTVFFVRREKSRYLQEPELKEEGGTPAIVESIRAGMVLQLKTAVGVDVILDRDEQLFQKALTFLSKCSNLIVLGPTSTNRLPIFSFLVYHPGTGRFLHHNFVAAVLNDVFGIQARGGCACAGPYAMDLLGLQEDKAKKLEELIAEDSRLDRTHLRRKGEYSHREILRPGFVRFNLPYFLDDQCVDFVLEALALTVEHAWKLLPQYLFNPETGEWRQRHFQTFKDRKWLGHISYQTGKMMFQRPTQHVKGPLPTSYQDCLDKAMEIFKQAEKTRLKVADQTVMFDEEAKPFRWFCLPSEANACLHGNHNAPSPILPTQLPFCPDSLLRRLGYTPPNRNRQHQVELPSFPISDSGSKNEKDGKWVKNDSNKDTNSNNNSSSFFDDKWAFSEGMVKALNDGFQLDSSSFQTKTEIDSENSLRRNDNVDQVRTSLGDNFLPKLSDNVGLRSEQNLPLQRTDKHLNGPDSISPENESSPVSENTKNSIRDDEMRERDKHFSTGETRELNSNSTEVTEKENSSDNKDQYNDLNSAGKSMVEQSAPFVCPLVRRPKPKNAVIEVNGKEVTNKNSPAVRWFAPPKQIFKPAVRALEEYSMLKSGDKVLVCLSGGKDSLSLLHTIRQYQFYARGKGIHFEFGAVTVDPQTPAYDPSPLKQYLATLGVPYFYESQGILETAENLPYECASICSFCSRMKRGRIYAAARREGYNVLALGQHLDDLSESFLMSFFHNGNLNTMKAHYTVKQGDLRVIRPFVYVRESDLRQFAEKNKLPIIAENCPACFEAPKERHRTKQLLASQEVMFPHLYNSMMVAMKPLMARSRTSNADTENGEGDEE